MIGTADSPGLSRRSLGVGGCQGMGRVEIVDPRASCAVVFAPVGRKVRVPVFSALIATPPIETKQLVSEGPTSHRPSGASCYRILGGEAGKRTRFPGRLPAGQVGAGAKVVSATFVTATRAKGSLGGRRWAKRAQASSSASEPARGGAGPGRAAGLCGGVPTRSPQAARTGDGMARCGPRSGPDRDTGRSAKGT